MKFLKDLLFPKVCLGCGLLGSHICLTCQKNLKKIDKDRCFYCKKPSFLGLTHPFCKKPYGVDGVISCFFYSDVLKRILKNIKYRLVREGLSELLLLTPPSALDKIARYNSLYGNIAIQEIPLFPTRKKKRGFNQSDEIARFISVTLNFPRASNLIRIRETFTQSQLKKSKDRIRNIKGAFHVLQKQDVYRGNILLVDDVMTSGATVSEASSVLKKAGADKVFVFTLAKG